jgi:D-alanyl-D-alanine carboxypeptidase
MGKYIGKLVVAFALVAVFVLLVAYCFQFRTIQNETATGSPYLVLVNKTHELPSGWDNKIKLDKVENSLGETIVIEHETYTSFIKLREELLARGIQIELDSVYRSVEDQKETKQWFLENYGEEYTSQYVAEPGFSEHHTGLAVDVFIMRGDEQIRDNDDMIADTEDFEVIHSLLPKHGFILRYLKGKEDITGYNYEPWHFRYVANPTIAQEITEQGITLEEYLGEF